ncbi:MAG: molybdate ABC transporter substrate-binding protein [Deltaproteobacteria bacterium]|nr:molybdate ABC transporter substrate-binding protein [Deltaproteobacteria bacterium]
MFHRIGYIFLITMTIACARPLHAAELLVSAAMSLKNAFEEIAPLYEGQEPSVTIRYNFGSSGTLEKQIEAGAPADIFASASQRFMNILAETKSIWPVTRRDFARNSMVLIVPRNNPAAINSFKDLGTERCRSITIGNPRSVPAGKYGAEVLKHMGIHKQVQTKLIFGEHVRQVLDYVARGELDAGIVYATDARIRSNKIEVIATAPPTSHSPVRYPIAVVNSSRQRELANKFVEFICGSNKARAVLLKHGFSPVYSNANK